MVVCTGENHILQPPCVEVRVVQGEHYHRPSPPATATSPGQLLSCGYFNQIKRILLRVISFINSIHNDKTLDILNAFLYFLCSAIELRVASNSIGFEPIHKIPIIKELRSIQSCLEAGYLECFPSAPYQLGDMSF